MLPSFWPALGSSEPSGCPGAPGTPGTLGAPEEPGAPGLRAGFEDCTGAKTVFVGSLSPGQEYMVMGGSVLVVTQLGRSVVAPARALVRRARSVRVDDDFMFEGDVWGREVCARRNDVGCVRRGDSLALDSKSARGKNGISSSCETSCPLPSPSPVWGEEGDRTLGRLAALQILMPSRSIP